MTTKLIHGSHSHAICIRGNCYDVLPQIPGGSVSLVVCDPPYGTTACSWDSVLDMSIIWAHLEHILTPLGTAVLFCSQPFTSILGASNPALLKYDIVWKKNNVTGFVHAKNRPLKNHEDMLVFSKGVTQHANLSDRRMTYNPQGLFAIKPIVHKAHGGTMTGMAPRKSHATYSSTQTVSGYPRTVWEYDTVPKGPLRFHPTQKPVSLLTELIRTYSNPGETVLDFTMGSGSTGVACARSGRHFIGVDLDSNNEYFGRATEWIQNTHKSLVNPPT